MCSVHNHCTVCSVCHCQNSNTPSSLRLQDAHEDISLCLSAQSVYVCLLNQSMYVYPISIRMSCSISLLLSRSLQHWFTKPRPSSCSACGCTVIFPDIIDGVEIRILISVCRGWFFITSTLTWCDLCQLHEQEELHCHIVARPVLSVEWIQKLNWWMDPNKP